MISVRLGAAVLNQTPLDWDNNAKNIRDAISIARDQGVDVLCLPELCVTGYGCEDGFLSSHVHATSQEELLSLVEETRGLCVSFGLPIAFRGGVFNCVALAADGKLLGLVGKRYLAGDGIHYEPRWFKPWPGGRHSRIEILGAEYPIGDLVFQCGSLRIGFEICEDAWVAERPGAGLARRDVDIILNPSASHFAFGKHEIRRRFVLEGSRAFSVGYAYANLLGNEAGRAIYDGDAMIAAGGKLLANGPRFSYQDALVTSANVELDTLRMNRARAGGFTPDVGEEQDSVVRSSFVVREKSSVKPAMQRSGWETSTHIKEEEFVRAESLALLDYVRKSRSRGFVVSISGGADSAAVSVLVAKMVDFAMAEIGRDGLLKKLSHMKELSSCSTSRDFVGALLTCVYQSTANSSETTLSAAKAVADGIGARFVHWDVDQIVEAYKRLGANGLKRPLTWEKDDIALQNIQARSRSPGVWLLANLLGSLLLSTSNRSEAAVGYATMDGDTSGGLAPIAGIDKAYLRRWLRWMESMGPEGVGPSPEVAKVNVQPPTAELRPHSSKQTDEADLMPYDVLDFVERQAIRDKRSPLDCLKRACQEWPDTNIKQMATWVERFFNLWCRNQWKRERYAPSFHLDDENLDPKTWCRFPILSGGFQRELKAMWRHVETLESRR